MSPTGADRSARSRPDHTEIMGAPPLSDHEFELFQKLIYAEAGIFLTQAKRALLIARLSGRIRALKLDSENLEQERGIVAEERRMRVDDVPRAKLNEEVEAVAFDSHPYGQPVIGWMTDIQHIPLQSCKDFFRTYYAPNNAVLCLAGDFDPAKARTLIKKAFADIPAQTPPAAVLESEDPQSGERRLTVSLPAEQPAINVAYHMVARRDPERLATAFLSRHDGLPEPLCAIYEPRSRGAILAQVAAGRDCPRKFLMENDAQLLDPVASAALDNANTPEDADAVRAVLDARGAA